MNKMVRQLLPFGTLTLIICILSALKPDSFLTAENILNVLSRSSVNGIIAMGITAVIISAGIDLSVGSMMALCGMVAGYVMLKLGGAHPQVGSMVAGTIAGIATGIACGLLNGTLITKLKLPPFIVTLGTMSAFRGISYVMNDGKMYDAPTYTYLGTGDVLGIPVCVLIFAVIVAAAGFILRYTRLGRYTYAIGSNREAAFHAGVNVDLNLTAVYALTGFVVGIAAMIATSRTVSAQPTAGISLELDIIASVVIGGASLAGGRGSVSGTIIGTLLISFLRNGCTLLGISTNVQLVVIGAIIIGAVALDQMARSRAEAGRS
jgi:ribose/xylose/arabinose/galactoside ABC-type transport system permease subunit